ncbi:D-glycero-beta-D-manno-heptose-7-phosphate kinase [candidate division KSB1 bacterium]
MDKLKIRKIKQLLNKSKGKKIAVFGDVMLDRYMWGKVSRISPEAPVPVVEVFKENNQLGGAANVANNIRSLGGTPFLFGIVGGDAAGKDILTLMKSNDLETVGIHTDESRPTTLKTRIIANNQHVVRADLEKKDELTYEMSNELLSTLSDVIKNIDGIIIQDYNKGVITKDIIHKVIEMAGKNDIPIAVDPKLNNFLEYKNVTLFKPNIFETQNALGFALDTSHTVSIAGKLLLDKLNCENVLITRSSKGMSLFTKGESEKTIQTKARKIHDVSGAGDTVISTLLLILTAGGSIYESAVIANYAAGVVCGEVGIVPVEPGTLLKYIQDDILKD